jgi:hypothetical protein
VFKVSLVFAFDQLLTAEAPSYHSLGKGSKQTNLLFTAAIVIELGSN